ncbi:TonB-dependent receptor domain-containing protein [Sphingomonas sp. SUN039]|uniref:TonB-dependent receptor domain-containing protein n=1 Tax=Sphingomonas sp. SUN039 TaxID=2937787 RepID=UPI0021642722|nr:TonB-dependent receptor [Sphingomonas sp. SUN039]UVO55678.1 TonB-dependent receptor [Sphingomonas sp. SUN039]
MSTRAAVRIALLCGAGVVASLPGHALAQSAPAPAEEAAPAAPEIIVTGTRVKRDGYDAPTPLTVVGEEAIRKAAPTNIADFVNQLPQLVGSTTPRTTAGTTSQSVAGLNLLSLRGLGSNRTLVLLDGQRIAPSTQDGSVDVNNVPSALLSRVDVVTGGASAAYGSDAVAGVVNFIIDGKFEGLKANLMAGITDRGDNKNYQLSAAFGASFADGRGHILVSGEHQHEDGIDILDPATRNWYNYTYLVPNPAYTATNGQPLQIVTSNVYYSLLAQGGLILNTALRGRTFGSAGTPRTFNYGTLTVNSAITSSNFMIGGDVWNEGNVVALTPRIDRDNLWGRFSYDFSDLFKLSLEGSYGRTHTINSAAYQRYANAAAPFAALSFSNPFLPASVRTQAAGLGLANSTFRYGYSAFDLGRPVNDNTRQTYRFVGTLSGEFAPGWSYNAYYQYGRTDLEINLKNTTNRANITLAVDAVTNGNGQIVCRSTLTNPTNGCVPLNVFGIGVASPAAIAYVQGTAWQTQQITQQVAALAINGEPFHTWAGPVSLAMGIEQRTERADAVGDTISLANGWYNGNFKTNSGSYRVQEGFAEVVVPLARDSFLGDRLDFNGAVRVTKYSTAGTVTTWKAGLTYQPIPDLMFRAVKSRDIRAPSITELYAAGSSQSVDVVDPQRGGIVTRVVQVTDGNTALTPEKADTLGLGVVVKPRFLPGFTASFDYYNIRLNDAITALSPNEIAARCFAGETVLCGFIQRDTAGVITQIRRVPVNVANLRVRGFDIDATYRLPLSEIFAKAGGTLTLRFLASRALNYAFTNSGVTNEAVGENGGPQASPAVPRWRTYSTLGYDDARSTFQLTMRTISSGVYDVNWKSGVDIDNNYIAAVKYFDLAGSYRLFGEPRKGVEAYFRVDNLFDQAPPVVGGNNASAIQTNVGLYDTIGRAYRIGVRVRY